MVALAVASLLGTFAVYTAFADSSIPVLMVSQASAYDGQKIRLEGKVTQTVPVVYTGAVPDAYKVGRDIVIDGTLENGVLKAVPDTLVTKCPSKYTDEAPPTGAKT